MSVHKINKHKLYNKGWKVVTDDEDALVMYKINETNSCVDIYIEESGCDPVSVCLVKEEIQMIYDDMFE